MRLYGSKKCSSCHYGPQLKQQQGWYAPSSPGSPKAQSVDSKDDELAEGEANARGVAALLDGLGGLHQLLLVQLADLGLQGEGRHCADAGHCLCSRLVGLVKQLAGLHMQSQSVLGMKYRQGR